MQLHYQARVGLLPEISAQTYDTFPKALREAILNSLDAAATTVSVEFDTDSRTLSVADDGTGMSLRDVQESFLSIGGSAKFGRVDQFGRIGIGSLALLNYAAQTYIETSALGSDEVVNVRLNHPSALGNSARQDDLNRFEAGHAWTQRGPEFRDKSFTRIRLVDLTPAALAPWTDTAAFFSLVLHLERSLPLPWVDGAMLSSLRDSNAAVASRVDEETNHRRHSVELISKWGRHRLKRRVFGDDPALGEILAGPVQPIQKSVVVYDGAASRRVEIFGCLAAQSRALPRWSGLTARVQNVAVEIQTFFGLETDPGFRRYVTGEIFIAGDVDSDRLINIDRESFNEESADYQSIRRYMTRVLNEFKRQCVQAPQRQRVQIRKEVERVSQTLERAKLAIERIAGTFDVEGLPSSNNGKISSVPERTIEDRLRDHRATVEWHEQGRHSIGPGLERGSHVVRLPLWLKSPAASISGKTYALGLGDGGSQAPPVLIRNRPREIRINFTHPSIGESADRAVVALAIEIAYVLNAESDAESLYSWLLDVLGVM